MNGSLRRSKTISLSDLARTAMQKLSNSNNQTDPVWHEAGGLRNEIRSLSMEVDRLSRVPGARRGKGEDTL